MFEFERTMSFQLDFQLKDEGGDIATYVTNGEWDLLGRRFNERLGVKSRSAYVLYTLHQIFLCYYFHPLQIFHPCWVEWTQARMHSSS